MPSFTITTGNSLTTRQEMSGTETGTVQVGGTLSVSANTQSIRFNGPTTNGQINNSGLIENTAAGGRAIRFEISVGSALTATIFNSPGTIQSIDDAIQIQAGSVTSGTVTVTNIGLIQSTDGQAIDFAGGTGTSAQNITNNGNIFSVNNDAIRIGGVGTIQNGGTINGGTAAAYSVSTDGIQFEANSSGSVTNSGAATITGDRHGINAGLSTTVTVVNQAGGTITGRNGSGVGLDGNGTITNLGTITGAFSNSSGSDINGSTAGALNGGGPDGINDGDGDGIDIDGQATIFNSGTIEGTGAGGTGSDGRFNTSEGIAAGGGSITNNNGATIIGLGLGILIDDSATGNAPFATTVINNGLIRGVNSFAIRIIGVQNDVIDNGGTIRGGGGTAIQLGDGNDTLRIRSGSTIVGVSDGQAGTDTLDYSAFTGGSVTVNLLWASATGTGGITGFESVIGSAQGDTITGNTAAESLSGRAGDDQISAGFGNDTLDGGEGADTLDGGDDDDNLYGGSGADSLVGGTGFDIARYDDSWGVQVDILFSNAFGSFAAGDTFSGIEGVSGSNTDDGVWGTDENNTIFTWLGNDYIDGRGGVDVLLGGANNDTLVGGAGGDYLAGEAGADVFRYIALTDSGPSAQDYLPDFSSAQGDKIDVSAFAGTATFNSGFGTGTSVYAFSQGGGAWTMVQFYQGSTLHLQMVVNVASLSAGDFIL